MKASSASSKGRRALAAGTGTSAVDLRQPFTNLRFRVAIEGIEGTGAVEVVFPTARLVALPRKRRAVQFDSLVIRRGLTLSKDWYAWWNEARRSVRAPRRDVQVMLLDVNGGIALRWIFPRSVPLSYSVSPLNAMVGAAVVESLELRIGDFELYSPE
jgi:T4-like virus tail tube protein gp19